MSELIAMVLLAAATQLPTAAPLLRDAAPRDPSATSKNTGIIRGRVTDRETGQPLARVLVELLPRSFGEESQSRSAGAMSERITVTGADGRYEYKDVPAGDYLIHFDPSRLRGTHLPQRFGEVEPAGDTVGSRPPPLLLADGEVRNDVSAALSRSLAIEGHVLDELGEPMANVRVSAHPGAGSARTIMGQSRSTDDRGAFRLFGLMPGQYRICASLDMHFQTTEDTRDRQIRTCYPVATLDADAELVALAGTDIGGIDIRVQRNRAFKITGIAIGSSGLPVERGSVQLVPFAENGFYSISAEIRGGGQFIARAVTPGEYAVRVEIGSFDPDDKREPELGYAPIRVDDADVEGIVVTTTRLAKIAGRITFEDGAPEKGSEPMRVNAETSSALGAMVLGKWPSAEVKNDFTFELSGLFGPHVLTVTGQPPGWVVRSVKYRDADVTDTPVEFKTSTDPAALEIAMTRRGAVVSGRVLEATGKDPASGYVLLIWAAPARRQYGPGIVKRVRSKADGSFTLGTIRAGEYVILAVTGETLTYLPLSDAEELERVAQAGERIVLGENEKREIDLRVVKPH